MKIVDAKCVKFHEDIPGGSKLEKNPIDLDSVGELEFRHLSSSTLGSSNSTSTPTPTSAPTVRFDPNVKVYDDKPITKSVGAGTDKDETMTDEDPMKLNSEQHTPTKQTVIDEISKIHTGSDSSNIEVHQTPEDLSIQDVLIYPETSSPPTLNPGRKRSRSETSDEVENRRKMAKILIAHAYYVAMLNAEPIHGSKNPVPLPTMYDEAINDPIHGPYWKEAVKV